MLIFQLAFAMNDSKMEFKPYQKFRPIFILGNLLHGMIEDHIIAKEEHLKELVIKLLKENNLSDLQLLDSLFTEIKQEFQSK